MRVKNRCRRLLVPVLTIIITWLVLLSSAQAWWNEEWMLRKKISLDTTASGAGIVQNLMEFPVLIRLHSGNFDFTKVKENGEDLRFVSSDGTTLLKYHIETFDAFDEIAYIWVKVPSVPGSNNQGTIWVYWGNEDAVSGQDTKNSFDPQYQAVFHFNEFEGAPEDAAAYSIHSSEYSGGLGLAGVIGNGATFSGAGNTLIIPDNPALNFSSGFTFSTWIKMFQPQEDAWLFSRVAGDRSISIGIQETKVVVRIADGTTLYQTEEMSDLPLDGWHHLAVTLDTNGRITVYLDGTESQWLATEADLSGLSGDIYIGADSKGDHSFAGDLDELRVSGIARSQGWIQAEYASQGIEAKLCSYAMEEIGEGGGGLPVFYLGTIFENITLDGLVVIGLLLILSGMSWVVMISKGIFLFNTSKGNKLFLNRFHNASDPTTIQTSSDGFNGSGIYRIYETGRDSLNSMLMNLNVDEPEVISEQQEAPARMTSKKMESLKAVLEEGLIDESKRLNSWLIVLTMSISGGPFLGLLGTVWGVMNTFAAMAEAGEANIMAIAPGVASALSTTVFGLIVAIPALFGYNYLSTMIRDITADSGIFVDQFALKVDSIYGENS